MPSKRSNTQRLNASGGDNSVAPNRPATSLFVSSKIQLELRNIASPRNVPPMPVVIWSFSDGGVVSPASSHSALPRNV
jgi:hypothetical protein